MNDPGKLNFNNELERAGEARRDWRVFIWILAIFLIAGAVLIFFGPIDMGGGEPEPVACPTDGKVCPDGSTVGRTGPNCEFAPCPPVTATSTPERATSTEELSETANWTEYETEFLTVKFPKGWKRDSVDYGEQAYTAIGHYGTAAADGVDQIRISLDRVSDLGSDISFATWAEEETSKGFAIVSECESDLKEKYDALCRNVNETDIKHFVNLDDEYYVSIWYSADDPERATLEKILGTIEFK